MFSHVMLGADDIEASKTFYDACIKALGGREGQIDPLGRVSRRRAERVAPFIYTGIQLVSHRLLRDAPEGPFSTNILWSRAIAEGRLYGTTFTGEWYEVGDPDAVVATEAALTRG